MPAINNKKNYILGNLVIEHFKEVEKFSKRNSAINKLINISNIIEKRISILIENSNIFDFGCSTLEEIKDNVCAIYIDAIFNDDKNNKALIDEIKKHQTKYEKLKKEKEKLKTTSKTAHDYNNKIKECSNELQKLKAVKSISERIHVFYSLYENDFTTKNAAQEIQNYLLSKTLLTSLINLVQPDNLYIRFLHNISNNLKRISSDNPKLIKRIDINRVKFYYSPLINDTSKIITNKTNKEIKTNDKIEYILDDIKNNHIINGIPGLRQELFTELLNENASLYYAFSPNQLTAYLLPKLISQDSQTTVISENDFQKGKKRNNSNMPEEVNLSLNAHVDYHDEQEYNEDNEYDEDNENTEDSYEDSYKTEATIKSDELFCKYLISLKNKKKYSNPQIREKAEMALLAYLYTIDPGRFPPNIVSQTQVELLKDKKITEKEFLINFLNESKFNYFNKSKAISSTSSGPSEYKKDLLDLVSETIIDGQSIIRKDHFLFSSTYEHFGFIEKLCNHLLEIYKKLTGENI